MKHLKKLGLASALALMVTCGVVGNASATTIEPFNTEVTLFSNNSSLAVSGGGTVSCTSSTITGDTPSAGGDNHTTWVKISVTTLTYSGCTALGFVGASVTPNEACHTPATSPQFHVMSITGGAIAVVTLPASCSIDVNIASIGCTLTIAGQQTIGNGTSGAGGIQFTNASPNTAHVNGATVPSVVSNGVGFGCASAGAHTGSLTGNYTRTSPTNITITP